MLFWQEVFYHDNCEAGLWMDIFMSVTGMPRCFLCK